MPGGLGSEEARWHTGGGGMALGHFVLPGIGTAVAVAVSSTLSHREANRIKYLEAVLDAWCGGRGLRSHVKKSQDGAWRQLRKSAKNS